MNQSVNPFIDTEDDHLSPKRRLIGWLTLALFVLLFMPSWVRQA